METFYAGEESKTQAALLAGMAAMVDLVNWDGFSITWDGVPRET